MRKILVFLVVILMISGCSTDLKNKNDNRYFDMMNLVNENQKFISKSDYYDLDVEISKIDNGYRYYIIIDNPRNALYNMMVLALEEGVEYHEKMASNIGIFEDMSYNLIPNQTYVDKGYVKGLSISGISDKEVINLKILVSWQDKNLSVTNREYIKITKSFNSEGK